MNPKKKTFKSRIDAGLMSLAIALFVLLVLTLLFWTKIFIVVEPGNTGVKYRPFYGGTHMERSYAEGLHIIFPWDRMYIYETRLQEEDRRISVLSKDGLPIELSLSVIFRPLVESLPQLQTTVGPEYFDRLVLPEAQSICREVIGQFSAEELYTTDGGVLAVLFSEAVVKVHGRWIELDELLVKEIKLPRLLEEAITNKMVEEQNMLKFDFILMGEEKEAERKRIEAQGIADFQGIVEEGISERLLIWKGIDATLSLAESPNAKVVIIGRSDDGLPLILDLKEGALGLDDEAAKDSDKATTGGIETLKPAED